MVASSKQIPFQIDGFASYRVGGGSGIRRVRVLALLVFFIMFLKHMSFEVSTSTGCTATALCTEPD